MAAGLVAKDITTATGETFSIIGWVPDTAAPDVGFIAVHRMIPAVAAAITSVAQNAASVAILAANLARIGLILINTGDSPVRVKYGAVASPASFTDLIPPDGRWVMPDPIYTGAIDAIWEGAGAGALIATELT